MVALSNLGCAANDLFGAAVAIARSSEVILVGAPGTASNRVRWLERCRIFFIGSSSISCACLSPQGSAALFACNSSSTERGCSNAPFALLSPTDTGADGDLFGQSVAISDYSTTVVVGSPGRLSSSGSAYVFSCDFGSLTCTAVGSVLRAPTPLSNGKFGAAVALSGDGTK